MIGNQKKVFHHKIQRIEVSTILNVFFFVVRCIEYVLFQTNISNHLDHRDENNAERTLKQTNTCYNFMDRNTASNTLRCAERTVSQP